MKDLEEESKQNISTLQPGDPTQDDQKMQLTKTFDSKKNVLEQFEGSLAAFHQSQAEKKDH